VQHQRIVERSVLCPALQDHAARRDRRGVGACAPDYGDGHKALVRWADGSEGIVVGSKVERA